MTSIAIQEQVEAIKKATTKASRTKKTAEAFLAAAGIVSTPVEKKIVKKNN